MMERTVKVENLKRDFNDKLILDVRRRSDLANSTEQLPGAHWHDPEQIQDWVDTLPQDQDIVLYCVRGGSVSNSVVDALHNKGLKAQFIEGGIEGWKSAGGKIEVRA